MQRLIELRFYVPPDTKYVISETFLPDNLSTEILKQIQESEHASVLTKYTTT